jgi:hypothetical protein
VASDAASGGAGLSLKSGAVGAGQKSEIVYSGYVEAGSVSFARKIAAQPGDMLQFFVDGILQGSWTGNSDWTIVSYPLPGVAHSFLWRFTKGGAGAGARGSTTCRCPTSNARSAWPTDAASSNSSWRSGSAGRTPTRFARATLRARPGLLHVLDELVREAQRDASSPPPADGRIGIGPGSTRDPGTPRALGQQQAHAGHRVHLAFPEIW